MTTNVTLHAGHDVAYFTRGQDAGGCAGAMSYYTAAGEPPGEWAGMAAHKSLGLTGQVDAGVLDRLFMKGIGPDGEILAAKRQRKDAGDREEAAVAAYRAVHPYASAVEIAEVRAAERGKDPHTVPYFDLTVSAVKSVSVLHASYRTGARQARDRGEAEEAAALHARAQEIEGALIESAREAVGWLEAHATYTRTGHHSSQTGEWRDGDGLTAAAFLHHISRDGDPQLHVHVAIWNRVQRADKADDKWRTLDSRTLHSQRLAVAATTDRLMETKLTGLGYVMVPRGDGNGAEVGGVGQDVMDTFSSRAVAITGELKRLAAEYEASHGAPPSRRTLWLLHQQAGQNTRRTKSQARRTLAGQTGSAEPTDAERLAAWEAQTTRREIQALSQVHGQVAQYAADHADRAPVVLDDAARRRAARIAVAEVQQHHAVWSMAQLRFEVHRALPVLLPGADADAVITEVAELAVSGRAGTGVVCVTAPDVTDVTSLGIRASDRGSIYRPPDEDRYSALEHLDTEEHILAAAGQTVPQLVTEARAREAVTGTGLNAEQGAAVVMMLAATTAGTALIAPAGAGKSHTMAAFAALWGLLTGRRVIGLATSTNAARVLESEGLAESYNIAEFLGKTEGSDELRRPVPLGSGDVLVIDEATQASTADLAMLFEAARAAYARVVLVGDIQQLGSPEAGGMFRLLAEEVPAAELSEIRRFHSPWEAGASVRLRAGDPGVIAVYDRHGRIRAADADTARERAAAAWLADHRRGKDVLLLAGSNEEAADLARRVQARLIQAGHVSSGGYQAHAALADGNQARPGDLIRARLNTEMDAGGRKLTNRDTLKITAIRGDAVEVRRQRLDGTWTQKFWLPRAYLGSSAELGYAGNVHVAQGRTVDTAHLLVTDTLSRQSLYVGMSRGREANTAHVVTGSTALPGRQPYQQAAPEAVLKNVMERDAGELSATEAIRQSQEWASGTGHLLSLWAAAVRPAVHAEIDQHITARLTETEAWRYQREHSRQALHAALRAAQLAGHDLHAVIGQITAAPLDGARSIASVLHGRLQRLHLPDPGIPATWTQRTPASAPPVARELAEALDARSPELGHRHAANLEPWLIDRLGTLPPGASPMQCADYERRAGIAAAYREAAGITSPNQAISPTPHRGNPELEHMRQEVIRELEYPDEAAMWAGMDRGQLEARTAAADRAQAAAPPDVSGELRLTAHAEADARWQAADAQVRNDAADAASASALTGELAVRRQQLEASNADYEAWAEATRDVRDNGDKAATELNHRGHTPPPPRQPPRPGTEPQTTMGWRPGADQEIARVDPAWWAQVKAAQTASVQAGKAARREASARAIPVTDAELARYGTGHQDATDTGQPRRAGRQPQAEDGPGAQTVHAARAPRTDPAADPGDPTAAISKAITDVQDAVQRIGAEQSGRQARSDYAARIARQAEAQPEATTEPNVGLAAQAPEEAEIG